MSTELINSETSARRFIRDGIAGNYEVIFEMVRVIRNSVKYDTSLERLAKNLLINENLDSYSPAIDQLEIVYNFVKSNVVYIQDLAGRVESIKSARQTLSDGYGDCDDHTNTNASILGCLGFEDVRIALAKYSKADESFVHVYCTAYVNGERFVLDTTLPNGELNAEVKAYEVKEVSIFDNVEGLDGISGLFTNARYQAKKFAKAAIETIPTATNFLPLGFISGNALATGATLISQSGAEKRLSLNTTASRINAELDKIIVGLVRSQIALDLAKSHALQVAAQLSAVEVFPTDRQSVAIIQKTIKDKLNFINNFKKFAEQHNIKVVTLEPRLMLCAGLGAVGISSYILYKGYKGRK